MASKGSKRRKNVWRKGYEGRTTQHDLQNTERNKLWPRKCFAFLKGASYAELREFMLVLGDMCV